MKAFPSRESIYGSDVIGVKENSGMDLRDYFAGLAMQKITWKKGEEKEDAEDCYVIADAMMKAREK
jgi:hypothetical protein